MGLQQLVELCQDNTRLHFYPFFLDIELNHLVQVFTEIDQDTPAKLISGPACAAAASGYRNLVLTGKFHRRYQVMLGFGLDDCQRFYPEQRRPAAV